MNKNNFLLLGFILIFVSCGVFAQTNNNDLNKSLKELNEMVYSNKSVVDIKNTHSNQNLVDKKDKKSGSKNIKPKININSYEKKVKKTKLFNNLNTEDIKNKLSNYFSSGTEIADIKPSGITGLYFFRAGNKPMMFMGDAQYIFTGHVFKMPDKIDLLDNYISKYYKKILDSYKKSDFVIYKPKNRPVRYKIIVFTDPSCGYCEKLHSELKQYLNYGLEIMYLPYPRAGENGLGYNDLLKVWCANPKKRSALLSEAINNFPSSNLPDNNVDVECRQNVNQLIDKTNNLNITGTPTVFLTTGKQIGGYLPPEIMLQEAEKNVE